MGARGPVPKRSDRKLGHTAKADRDAVTRGTGAANVEVPEPDPDWHPVASRWFASLAESGQSYWYEPSDWAAAYVLAESMSRELSPQPIVGKDGEVHKVTLPPKGASLAAWRQGMASLLVTEADRRRALVELQRPPQTGGEEGGSDVADLDRYRNRIPPAG